MPWADLYLISVDAPDSAVSGSTIDITWRVGNQGIGLTNGGEWFDQVFLERTDGTGRVRLGNVTHLGFLSPGDAYGRKIGRASCRGRGYVVWWIFVGCGLLKK